MSGFLGTGAPFSSDLNLLVQLAMGVLLLVGMVLARKRRYRLHQYCQSSVMLLNLVLIGFIMVPAFIGSVAPEVPQHLGTAATAVPVAHAALGLIAELLGLFVVLVAGTRIVPRHFRFRRYKVWMRTTLAIWWLVLLVGFGTYYEWYLGPSAGLPVAGVNHERHEAPDGAEGGQQRFAGQQRVRDMIPRAPAVFALAGTLNRTTNPSAVVRAELRNH
jgi:uncharacterized membrane protein YozB (DUF420 family)